MRALFTRKMRVREVETYRQKIESGGEEIAFESERRKKKTERGRARKRKEERAVVIGEE